MSVDQLPGQVTGGIVTLGTETPPRVTGCVINKATPPAIQGGMVQEALPPAPEGTHIEQP